MPGFRCACLKNGGEAGIMRKRKDGVKASDDVAVVIDDEFRRKFSEYCLMDDYYMSVFFKDDPASAQCVLRVILEKSDLIVESVRTQEVLFGAAGRRAVLDVLATDSAGNVYDIEVQRAGDGADPLRARYYSSLLDANMLSAGAGYSELREKYVIFITENDVFGRGLPVYRFSRTLEGDGMSFGDRDHIVYVNGSCRDAGTALGRLVQDFFCCKAEDMHYEELKKRTKELKGSRKGGENMSDVIRELVEKGIERGREEGIAQGLEKGLEKGIEKGKAETQAGNVRNMLADGLPPEQIRKLLRLTEEEYKRFASL